MRIVYFFFLKTMKMFFNCYEISDIDTINQIKQNPDNIDVILNNLAKDYSKKMRIKKTLYSTLHE